MSLPTAVHIGFAKTGTTTHQIHLFSKHPQICYLGKPYENDILKKEILNLIMGESLTYNSSSLKEFLLQLEIYRRSNEGKVILISDELFVSASKVRDKGLVAQRIKDVFEPGKILITIRNQWELLKSAYINGGRLLKNIPARYKGFAIEFKEWLEMSFETPQRSYIGNIVYADTIDYYSRLFGKDNVGVFLFEDFLQNKDDYIRRLSDFLGIDARESARLLKEKHENPRLSQSQVDFELASSKFGPAGKIPLVSVALRRLFDIKKRFKSSGKASVEMPDEWKERLRLFYSEGNMKLIKNHNLPLEKYEYPI